MQSPLSSCNLDREEHSGDITNLSEALLIPWSLAREFYECCLGDYGVACGEAVDHSLGDRGIRQEVEGSIVTTSPQSERVLRLCGPHLSQ